MRNFRTFLNHREQHHTGELNTLPSHTQPDEVLSIKQMLLRHVRGLPTHHSNEIPVYHPEAYGFIPDTRTLDLTELDEMSEYYKQTQERIRKAQAPTGSEANTDEGGRDNPPQPPQPPTDRHKQPAEGAPSPEK